MTADEKKRAKLVKSVRAAGEYLAAHADEIVYKGPQMLGLDIYLTFKDDEIPTIMINTEIANTETTESDMKS